MSKRRSEIFTNNSKKQKLDDSFWDNDIDDDCFGEIASRLLEQDELAATQPTQGNNSILPSFDSFRSRTCFSSTQIPPTSTVFKNPPDLRPEPTDDVQMKVSHLEQKCVAKEGEVTVLRAQLQKFKSEMMTQQSNKYKEYFEKMNQKEKEIRTIRGQLDFKNLEIANLKQNIAEISKANLIANQENSKRSRIENSSISSVLTNSNLINRPRKNIKSPYVADEIETFILSEVDVPLLSKFPHSFFESSPPEVHVLESRTNQYGKNTIPHFHNQMIQEEFFVPSGPKVIIKISNKEVSLEHIYPEMLKIIKCNSEEINSEENNECLRNILSMSVQLLQHFEGYLEVLEKYYSAEDIEQMDKIFLQNNYNQYNCNVKQTRQEGEIGIRAGKTVRFLAEVLPFNSYLSSVVIFGKSFSVDGETSGNNWSYLSLLGNILTKIFLLRKTEVCYGFLNSVAILLLNISKSNLYEKIFPKFNDLLGLLLFTRPSTFILHKLLMIFKNCSTSMNFLDFLCRKPESKKFLTDKKRKLQYFNEESCKFSLFVALFNTGLNNVKDEEILLDVAVNILSFVYNIFMENPSWIYEQQKDHCMCSEQLYQITIEVSYKCMLRFWDKSCEKEIYRSLFKSIIKVLRLLNFNSCNLMEKYDDTHSKYQEMSCTLLDAQKIPVYDLSNLNISEEIPHVPASNLDLL